MAYLSTRPKLHPDKIIGLRKSLLNKKKAAKRAPAPVDRVSELLKKQAYDLTSPTMRRYFHRVTSYGGIK